LLSPQSASKSTRFASKQENKKIIVSPLSVTLSSSSSQSPVQIQTRTFRNSMRLSQMPSEAMSPNKSPSSLKRVVKNELTSPSTSSISSQTSISTRSQRSSHQHQQTPTSESRNDHDDEDDDQSRNRRSSDRIRRVKEEIVVESTPKKEEANKRRASKEVPNVKLELTEMT